MASVVFACLAGCTSFDSAAPVPSDAGTEVSDGASSTPPGPCTRDTTCRRIADHAFASGIAVDAQRVYWSAPTLGRAGSVFGCELPCTDSTKALPYADEPVRGLVRSPEPEGPTALLYWGSGGALRKCEAMGCSSTPRNVESLGPAPIMDVRITTAFVYALKPAEDRVVGIRRPLERTAWDARSFPDGSAPSTIAVAGPRVFAATKTGAIWACKDDDCGAGAGVVVESDVIPGVIAGAGPYLVYARKAKLGNGYDVVRCLAEECTNEPVVLATVRSGLPSLMGADAAAVYWASSSTAASYDAAAVIAMCPIAGCPERESPRVIAVDQRKPSAITMDATTLYWSAEGAPPDGAGGGVFAAAR